MTEDQRQQLQKFEREVHVQASDPRWSQVTAWQRRGWVRVRPINRGLAGVTLTDAGRAALREAPDDGC